MLKVILVDDEPLARQLIRSYLKAWPQITITAECTDGYEGYKAIQADTPDLVFLDIQMPRINGFELLELLDTPPAVIFTTAFDEYALKAFDAHAIDYLLKPVTKERFETAIRKWMQQDAGKKQYDMDALLSGPVYNAYQHRVVVKEQGRIMIIPAQDIHYMEASDDYVRIVTADGIFLKKSTLIRMEQLFDPKQFVRVHRSFFVPVGQLLKIEPYEKDGHLARLHCGTKIPVSKAGLQRLKTLLGW